MYTRDVKDMLDFITHVVLDIRWVAVSDEIRGDPVDDNHYGSVARIRTQYGYIHGKRIDLRCGAVYKDQFYQCQNDCEVRGELFCHC